MAKNDPYRTTFHRDGTVTVWNVYTQSWLRSEASKVSPRLLATLNARERERIARMAAK